MMKYKGMIRMVYWITGQHKEIIIASITSMLFIISICVANYFNITGVNWLVFVIIFYMFLKWMIQGFIRW